VYVAALRLIHRTARTVVVARTPPRDEDTAWDSQRKKERKKMKYRLGCRCPWSPGLRCAASTVRAHMRWGVTVPVHLPGTSGTCRGYSMQKSPSHPPSSLFPLPLLASVPCSIVNRARATTTKNAFWGKVGGREGGALARKKKRKGKQKQSLKAASRPAPVRCDSSQPPSLPPDWGRAGGGAYGLREPFGRPIRLGLTEERQDRPARQRKHRT